jgi:hypothetical protein
MVPIDGTDYQMNHYEEVLYEARKKGETIANKYIFELYTILRDEEHLPPEDCRAKIEQDCMVLWSKATIRKFLPEEAKNPKKSKAGKIGAKQKKIKLEEDQKSKSLQIIEQNADGSTASRISSSSLSGSSSGARTNPAENDSVHQNEEESRRFHAELNQVLESRVPSPELLEAHKIISEKDQRIEELETLKLHASSSGQTNSELYLPYELAEEIYDIIDVNRAARTSKIDFILRHDGSRIIAVESLSGTNSISKKSRGELKVDS